MAKLHDILYRVRLKEVQGDRYVDVSSLQLDSRTCEPHSLFFAVPGVQSDGHAFIQAAIAKGARVVVCTALPVMVSDGVSFVVVEDVTIAMAEIAGNFYDHPSKALKLIGVTGTNGKTTIATLGYKLFRALGYDCGLISTVENLIGAHVLPATHTTPNAIELNQLLRKMVDAGCTHVFMEVSSHAIHQNRVHGIVFTGGLFSNITHDHLDYHKTFDAYIKVKKKFFDDLPSTAFAISNADDKRGMIMLQNTVARSSYYSLKSMAAIKGKVLENNLSGLVMTINEQEVHFRMIGLFNAYNLMAVYGAAVELGEDKQEVLLQLSKLTGAEGRFDYQVSPRDQIIGIVDYAHTPDALVNVLQTIQTLRKGHEQVITVVGCGGDRDRTKRPIMAAEAAALSDRLILTSDNPRTEEPTAIIQEMEQGLNSAGKRKSVSIGDRREAIKTAVMLAKTGDIILVAGKGHEKYQEVNGVKHHFDDKEVLSTLFMELDR
jgi:UDP-N-acetylmuramoyl-L-alanyl-D-glutamate--2,6-diaminopimelate ligase